MHSFDTDRRQIDGHGIPGRHLLGDENLKGKGTSSNLDAGIQAYDDGKAYLERYPMKIIYLLEHVKVCGTEVSHQWYRMVHHHIIELANGKRIGIDPKMPTYGYQNSLPTYRELKAEAVLAIRDRK